MTIDIVRNT